MNYVDCWAEYKVDGIIDGKQIKFELIVEECFINSRVRQGVVEKWQHCGHCDTVNAYMNECVIIQINI